nr:MAG TPA: His-Me finger endonuclease beta4-alpha2 domain [Caudoviricetes sp.]
MSPSGRSLRRLATVPSSYSTWCSTLTAWTLLRRRGRPRRRPPCAECRLAWTVKRPAT